MKSLPLHVILFTIIVGFICLPNSQARVVNKNDNSADDKANTDNKVELADTTTLLAVTNVPSSIVIPGNITKTDVETINHESKTLPDQSNAVGASNITTMQDAEISSNDSTQILTTIGASTPSTAPPAVSTTAITTIVPSTSTTPVTTSTTQNTTTIPTTTAIPTTSAIPTTNHEPNTTTTAHPTTTLEPTTPAPPVPCHRFDGPSFTGGIVLTLGVLAISLVAYKFKARSERNYETL